MIAGTGFLGTRFLAFSILTAMVLLAVGWPSLMRATRPWVGSVVIAIGAPMALVAVLLGRNEPYLRHMVVAVAGIVIASLVAEVFFPSGEGRVVTSVAGTAAGGMVAASGAAWVAAARTVGAEDLVVTGAVALAVAAVASVATRNANVNSVLAVVTGAAAGFGTGFVFESISWYAGMLAGIASGTAVMMLAEVYRREPRPAGVWSVISSGLTPVLAVGMLIYFGGRLLVG